MNCVPKEWDSAEVHDHSSLVVEDHRSTMKLRPIGRNMSAYYAPLHIVPPVLWNTYMAKGQSDRASVRIISGRLAARTLYIVCADAMMHLPPDTAVLLVSQLTMSPASSLWKVCRGTHQLHITQGVLTACESTYNGSGGVTMVARFQLGRVISNDVN